MKIHYWESDCGNFGDDLNIWLWETLMPGIENVYPDTTLVGVGTIFNEHIPKNGKKLVIGSGAGYGSLPDMNDGEQWDIRCLRGRSSTAKAGIDDRFAISDPAILIADMEEFQNLPPKYDISFLPHWESELYGIWDKVCKYANIHHISPCQDSKHVLREIAQSKLIIAESMHAAILADAFRIPWIPVRTSHEICDFKWNDWLNGLGLEYTPHKIANSSLMEARYKSSSFWGMKFNAEQLWEDLNAKECEPQANNSEGEAVDVQHDSRASSVKGRFKSLIKVLLMLPAIYSLKKASMQKTTLSNEAILKEKKQQLYSVLENVKKDYMKI